VLFRSPSAAGEEKAGPSSFKNDESHPKFYFRTPGEETNEPLDKPIETVPAATPQSKPTKMTDNIVRKKIAGIDVITAKTGVKNVITFRGNIIAGDVYSSKNNTMIADLTGRMLDKGTLKNDKFALAEKLENMGAELSFSVGAHVMTFRGKCLKNDISSVISLLAEQLREPAFDEEEFIKLKSQREGSLKRLLEDTEAMANQKLDRILFSENHPNYSVSVETLLEHAKNASLDEVKAFYKKYYGTKSMIFVAAGDVDTKIIHESIEKDFDAWGGGRSEERRVGKECRSRWSPYH